MIDVQKSFGYVLLIRVRAMIEAHKMLTENNTPDAQIREWLLSIIAFIFESLFIVLYIYVCMYVCTNVCVDIHTHV